MTGERTELPNAAIYDKLTSPARRFAPCATNCRLLPYRVFPRFPITSRAPRAGTHGGSQNNN